MLGLFSPLQKCADPSINNVGALCLVTAIFFFSFLFLFSVHIVLLIWLNILFFSKSQLFVTEIACTM
jgi:hypothetical protein